MRASHVELREVRAGYDVSLILRNISLAVQPGHLLAILGPSGCGKTTILRVIAGLLAPASGDVLFDGTVVTTVPPERREAAMVFQKPLLFPHLTVGRNVGFGLRMRGISPEEIQRRSAQVLELVRLPGFEQRSAHQLSGGQEQRVALARALVTEPRVLLLDEPFAALDEELRSEMRDLVREAQQRLGITTVFVTHDREEAARISDRIALMLQGSIEQEGTAGSLFREPATASAARFFGWRLWTTEHGREVYYRPEDARVEPANQGPHEGLVTSSIDTGICFAITIALDSGAVLEVRQTNAGPRTGERAGVCIPKQALRVY